MYHVYVHMHVCRHVFRMYLYTSVNINRQEFQQIQIHLHWCVNKHLFLCGSRCNCIDSDCLEFGVSTVLVIPHFIVKVDIYLIYSHTKFKSNMMNGLRELK